MQGLYYGTTEVTERRGGKGEDVTALTHQEDEARIHADLIFWELLAFFGSWSYSKPEKAENQISNFTSYFVLQFL